MQSVLIDAVQVERERKEERERENARMFRSSHGQDRKIQSQAASGLRTREMVSPLWGQVAGRAP